MSILDKPNYGELTRQAVLAELALNNPRSVVYPVDRVFNIVQIETTWGTKPKAGDVAAVAADHQLYVLKELPADDMNNWSKICNY